MKKTFFGIMAFVLISYILISQSVYAATAFSVESRYENTLGNYSSWMFEVDTPGQYEVTGLPLDGSIDIYHLEERIPEWPPRFVGSLVQQVKNSSFVNLLPGKYYFVNPKNFEGNLYIAVTHSTQKSSDDIVIVPLPYFKASNTL